MSSKSKNLRTESEIEKYRSESNWKKAVETARAVEHKALDLASLVLLVYGEGQLEEFLLEHEPVEKNHAKAKAALASAEDQLHRAGQSRDKIGIQAQLLLGKLLYCCGEYRKALDILDQVDLHNVVLNSASSRMYLIAAEAYAVKGFCLEKVAPPSTSKYRAAEREENIISCYESAGDLAILYFQDHDKNMPASTSSSSLSAVETGVGPILDRAIQQSPIMLIKNGDLLRGVNRFRELLRAVECRYTQNIRQSLAKNLAEVLIRGMCETTYKPIDLMARSSQAKGPKPRVYTGDRFVPEDINEEVLLLLLISEAIATREAVLDRSAEAADAREHAFANTSAVYDLLAIVLVRRAQFNLLFESFERALRFSFEEFHIWHQFANSLICAGKYSRALLVLKECYRLKPRNPVVPLQAAKLCYEYLHQYQEGVNWSKKAIEIGNNHPFMARSHMALGIGYSMQAIEARLQAERLALYKQALMSFKVAHEKDPQDYLVAFHVALQYAVLRQIPEALTYVRLALTYRSDHVHSLHLLVLLLTAQKQNQEAMLLIQTALEEYPENLSLLLTKSKLEEVLLGPEEALASCREMMKLWKDIHEIDSEEGSDGPSHKVTDRNTWDKRSLAQLTMNEFSERGSGSVRAESMAASRMERALSEVASSLNSSFMPRPGSQQSWLLQAQIWLQLAELYLVLNKVSEAEACVVETSSMFPLSHQVYFMRGRVLEHKQQFHEARVCYENAIAINPGHTKSLHHLGDILHLLGDNKLAEKILRDAINMDPTAHAPWYTLGTVLQALGRYEAASDCLLTAAGLEATSPIVPFTVIPRLMQ
ncbi:LOW QUALITY PROTEIN: tetratricopeptide repeat protein 7B-like [Pomacea canaliculata]|uniref:LOW QUALITY PROTEIN: tetratricopeptide repeat protein 7B-like n=1 Tax=Pomacea canaliculata TaxID=400727 RepID=UPI000D72B8CF|nr:LOW QUALITY PROTEIN: tetratricopeptide repeat protein 7B-like [Pomacea canaliculata]